MGWAERANPRSQEKKQGKLKTAPKLPLEGLRKLREQRLQNALKKMEPKNHGKT